MMTRILAIFCLLVLCEAYATTNEPAKKPSTAQKFDCSAKYCKDMDSCDEACYKFKYCGKLKLDRDEDEIPCENVCDYKCKYDCSEKYCKDMVSCDEACYQFKYCGKSRLDRDDDGIPCKNVCDYKCK